MVVERTGKAGKGCGCVAYVLGVVVVVRKDYLGCM